MQDSIHDAVGAIIVKKNKILLIDRSTFPKGISFPAGHIEKGESPSNALIRELKEETNLEVSNYKLIYNQLVYNTPCNKGSSKHNWFIFTCEIKGRIKKNNEAKKLFWQDISKLKDLDIDRTWSFWLKKFNYL